MPKVTNTKKQRAAELLRTLEKGPEMFRLGGIRNDEHMISEGEVISEGEAKRRVMLWLDTWITPEVRYLLALYLPKKD